MEESVNFEDGSSSKNFYVFDSATGKRVSIEQRILSLKNKIYKYELDCGCVVEATVSIDKETGCEFLKYALKDVKGDKIGTFLLPGYHFNFNFDTSYELVQKGQKNYYKLVSMRRLIQNFFERYFAANFETKTGILTRSFRRYNRSVGESGYGIMYAFLSQDMYNKLRVDEDFISILKKIAANDIHREDNQSTEQVFNAMFKNINK
ncbi:hypothetical protein [Pseudoalteromonas sp. B160]|uniref:hypothetical protein n=1 Tax=Pseudoalteromonas sp. B160 TaxID=630414 RepID=UPI00301C6931